MTDKTASGGAEERRRKESADSVYLSFDSSALRLIDLIFSGAGVYGVVCWMGTGVAGVVIFSMR